MGLAELKFLYDILKDRPELFIVVATLIAWYMERSERKTLQAEHVKLIDKMADQNKDTNELLANIRFLLEVLTKGRV